MSIEGEAAKRFEPASKVVGGLEVGEVRPQLGVAFVVEAFDGRLLDGPFLRSANEQDDQFITVPGEVEPVIRSPIDQVLPKAAADSFDLRQITQFQTKNGYRHLGRGLGIEIIEP